MRTIACPECDEAIEVEAGMEGRRVVCPECETKFTVPERERKKTGAKKKRPKKSAGPKAAIIGSVAVLLLLVVGFVVYKATRPKSAATPETAGKSGETSAPTGGDSTLKLNLPIPGGKGAEVPAAGPPPPIPRGWAKYTLAGADLVAHLPSAPEGPAEASSDMGVRVKDLMWICDLPMEAGGYQITVMLIPDGTTLTAEQEGVFLRLPRHSFERKGGARFVAERAGKFGGYKATELDYALPTGEPVAVRYGFVRSGGKQMFVIATAGGKGTAPADRTAFFDSIRPAK